MYRIRHRTMALCVQPISASLLREGNDSCTPLLHACSLLASHGVRACAYGWIRRPVTTNIGRENFNVSTAFNPSRPAAVVSINRHEKPFPTNESSARTCRPLPSCIFRDPRETDISPIRMQRRWWTSISTSNPLIQIEIFSPSTLGILFFSPHIYISIRYKEEIDLIFLI